VPKKGNLLPFPFALFHIAVLSAGVVLNVPSDAIRTTAAASTRAPELTLVRELYQYSQRLTLSHLVNFRYRSQLVALKFSR